MNFFYLLPYLLVPVFVGFVFYRFIKKWRWLSFLVTFGLLFYYPVLVNQINALIHPPVEPQCGTGEGVVLIISLIVLLPIALMVQLVINLFFKSKVKLNG